MKKLKFPNDRACDEEMIEIKYTFIVTGKEEANGRLFFFWGKSNRTNGKMVIMAEY